MAWIDIKSTRGIDDVDFGEVREVDADYLITERGVINKEQPLLLVIRLKLNYNCKCI
jgi:hypothetical protein